MGIPVEKIKELREKSGAGIMDCRSALLGCGGDIEKALEVLREKGLITAKKKAERTTSQGPGCVSGDEDPAPAISDLPALRG